MSPPAHILLVDDNRLDVELAIDGFRDAGTAHVIHVADGGQSALDYLAGAGPFADRIAHPLPDLILLDIKMPGIDGVEVLRRVKAMPGLKRIPILVMTSSREEQDRARCYDNGVNGYIEKPGSFDGYTDVVRTVDSFWLELNVPPPLDP